ncbi:MAG TPA: hypothetical protein VM935_04175, partial [Chitinophagaceae bacterium]|nr:hypothetical protein [Chitinophagaceae bacterium]
NDYTLLGAFLDHGRINWPGFETLGITGCLTKTQEGEVLRARLESLESHGFLKRVDKVLPPTWEITEEGNEQWERLYDGKKQQAHLELLKLEDQEKQRKKLHIETELLEKTLRDYRATRRQAQWAIILSIIAIVTQVILQIIQWKS